MERRGTSAGRLDSLRGLLVIACLVPASCAAAPPKNFIYFELERSRIFEKSFLTARNVVGAQLKYTWPELEPKKGVYDFHAIEHDLAFLTSKGKRLFIQLQDVTFRADLIYVPGYLRSDPVYAGGAVQQFEIPGNDETKAKPEGWVARRWDPEVAKRFHLLLKVLGERFDGRIEGINLPETAVEFGDSGTLYPPGFTPEGYRDAILANMTALKHSFPKSVTMIYANFMPGEWLPHPLLSSVYDYARKIKVGVGGPDMIPYQKHQLSHSYPLIRESNGQIPTGLAVQDGDYVVQALNSQKLLSVGDLYRYAAEDLKLDYLFWCTEEPHYSKSLLPFLNNLSPS